MDKNLSSYVKILVPEQIVLGVMFYFGQVFVFCRLINKDVRMVFYQKCVKCILWPDLQTFLLNTIPPYVFDEEDKVGKCSILKSYLIKLTKAATGGV